MFLLEQPQIKCMYISIEFDDFGIC